MAPGQHITRPWLRNVVASGRFFRGAIWWNVEGLVHGVEKRGECGMKAEGAAYKIP